MALLYSFVIRLYATIIWVVSPFNPKAKLWCQGRTNIITRLSEKIKSNDELYWFHVSSLGEFEQGRPVIEALKKQLPKAKIMLTFFSPSGYEVRKNYTLPDYIYYLPLDTKHNARQFIQITQPKAAIFVKYDYWYHYLNDLNKNNIPTYIISAIFRKNQLFFKWYGKWYRKLLRHFTKIFVQDQCSAELLHQIHIKQVAVSGDTRFDRVLAIAEETKSYPVVEAFVEDKKILIGGSTWLKDEEILSELINHEFKDWKCIIAPHEIHDSRITKLTSLLKVPYVRYSKTTEQEAKEAQVLIIDNIGMLSSLYKYSHVAYIGGGFGAGIHNILEAAVFGLPVFFGPNYQRFKEARELIEQKGAFPITTKQEFQLQFKELVENTTKLKNTSTIAAQYVKENSGATETILNTIFKK